MPPAHSSHIGNADTGATAAQPTSAPQLKVRPSQACGHQVMRFMKG